MKYLLAVLFAVALAPSSWGQSECGELLDSNQDGFIGVEDLMNLLSHFGDQDLDLDGIFDSVDECVDETACNYQSNPTESCMYIDVLGVCGGICNEDADNDGICDFECGLQTAHEGYNYATIQIGQQCWFAENCRYLPTVSPSNEESVTDPYYYVFDYQGSDVDEAIATENYETSGVLYNWPAVMTEGICPTGWHIPSDEEWTQLSDFLGVDAGYQMKSTSGWSWQSNGSNSSGFDGVPGGYKSNEGGNYGFYGSYEIAHFWASTEGDYNTDDSFEDAWMIYLYQSYDHVTVNSSYPRNYGISARCLKDQ